MLKKNSSQGGSQSANIKTQRFLTVLTYVQYLTKIMYNVPEALHVNYIGRKYRRRAAENAVGHPKGDDYEQGF